MKNGLRVFVYPTPYLESVAIAIGVNYGSMDDGDKTIGAAHFLEHMILKGTKTRTVNQIREEAREMGLIWNAFTNMERTLYFFQAYKDRFSGMMELLSDMVVNSTIPKAEFELERGPVINEELMRQDNNQYFFWDHLPQAVYTDHPAGRKNTGNRESINRLKREDLIKVYETHYSPENMVLTIYGNVKLSEAKRLAVRHFSKFSRKYVKKERRLYSAPQVKNEVVVRRENIKQSIIGMGFRCGEFHPSKVSETVSLMVAAMALNYRVMDEVRIKRGLAYTPFAVYAFYNSISFIGAQAAGEHQKISEIKQILLAEFEKMEKGALTESDIERAKNGLIAQYRIMRENTMSMANTITSFTIMTGDYKFVENLPDLISQVKLADVKKYCKKYIKAGKYSSVILKPE